MPSEAERRQHSNPCPKCGRTEIHKLCSELKPPPLTFDEWWRNCDTFNNTREAAEVAWNASQAALSSPPTAAAPKDQTQAIEEAAVKEIREGMVNL